MSLATSLTGILLIITLFVPASCLPSYTLVEHRTSGLNYASVSPDGNYSMLLKDSQTLEFLELNPDPTQIVATDVHNLTGNVKMKYMGLSNNAEVLFFVENREDRVGFLRRTNSSANSFGNYQ